MRDVEITILTPGEAQRLRVEAQLVLRSVRRRKVCECEQPWRDGNACARCGKWLKPPSVETRLMRHIEALDEAEAA